MEVVQILKKYVRSYDIVSRIGGDEFSVLLVDIPKAAVIKRRIFSGGSFSLSTRGMVYQRDFRFNGNRSGAGTWK